MLARIVSGTNSYHASGGLDFGDEFRDGFKDHSRASQQMLDVLMTESTLGRERPRWCVCILKLRQVVTKAIQLVRHFLIRYQMVSLARSRSCLFAYRLYHHYINRDLKSPIMTASEVNFLKAEAYQRGWANGDPKQAFVKGVLESVKFL